jgi:glycosidase
MVFEAAEFWLRDVGVDGWRLDVAHEISPGFWRDFAAVCRAAKADCVLVGELIHGKLHTSPRTTVQPSCLFNFMIFCLYSVFY